jgi:hypothetical protein
MRLNHWLLAWALFVMIVTVTGRAGARCVGDCDGDGAVTIDELLAMVNIALDANQVSTCTAGDADQDGQITIDEILEAVNNALGGCGPTVPDVSGAWAQDEPALTSTTCDPIISLLAQALVAARQAVCIYHVAQSGSSVTIAAQCCDPEVEPDCPGPATWQGSVDSNGQITASWNLTSENPGCIIDGTDTLVIAAGDSPTTASHSLAFRFSGCLGLFNDCAVVIGARWERVSSAELGVAQ